MKANQTSEEIWISIVTHLQAAHKGNAMMIMSPQSQPNQEIANAKQYSIGNWNLAKYVYFQHKEAMDALFETKRQENDIDRQVLMFQAMTQVCEEEASKQFEQQILLEDNMKQDNNNELDLDEVKELDEDELYAKETEGQFGEDDENENDFEDESDFKDEDEDEEY